MIDTHCHLTDERLSDQLDDVLTRSRAASVTRIITIGVEPADFVDAIEIAEAHPEQVSCAVGLHPCYLPSASQKRISMVPTFDELEHMLREAAKKPAVVAIGEIGLDKHWDREPSTLAKQREYFEFQLGLARKLNKPVILHTREAIDDALDVLANFPAVRAVFHSFTGTPDEARRITDRGHTIGFTGPVTYKKNDALREAARLCPIDQILVETDGPYLSPEPVRSQRICEPAFVMHTARRIAEERGMTLEAFDEATTNNARRIFSLSC